jgi:hypothetical protein
MFPEQLSGVLAHDYFGGSDQTIHVEVTHIVSSVCCFNILTWLKFMSYHALPFNSKDDYLNLHLLATHCCFYVYFQSCEKEHIKS